MVKNSLKVLRKKPTLKVAIFMWMFQGKTLFFSNMDDFFINTSCEIVFILVETHLNRESSCGKLISNVSQNNWIENGNP